MSPQMSPQTAFSPELVISESDSFVPEWFSTATIILASDVLALALAFWTCAGLRMAWGGIGDVSLYWKSFPVVFFCLVTFRLQGLYPGILLHPAEEMRSVFYAVTKVFLVAIALNFFWRVGEDLSRFVLLGSWVLSIALVLGMRNLLRWRFSARKWWGLPTVVIGSGENARRVAESLRESNLGLRLTGMILHPSFEAGGAHLELPVPERLPLLQRVRPGSYVVLAMPGMPDQRLWTIVRDYCEGFRHVLYLPDLRGVCSLGICVREMKGQIGFEIRQNLLSRSAAVAKRGVDLLLAGIAVVGLAPVLVAIAVLIRLTSKGAALFTQNRVGFDGKTIAVFKFRTMVVDGDRVLDAYLAANPGEHLHWLEFQKLKHDPRVTAVGRWLRRLSIDELPQLFNVLLGNMSLVGPRPMMHSQVLDYGPAANLYERVRPGITGLWQVSGRNRTTFAERAAFDEYYVRNWSIWLDFYILVRTVKTVVTCDGAY